MPFASTHSLSLSLPLMILKPRMFRFPSTSPAVVIRTLLLILATILTATSDQEFSEAYYELLGPGYSFGYLQTSPEEQFSSTENLLECAGIALNSQSEFFTYDTVSYVCKNYSPKNMMTVVSANNSNELSYYKNSVWIKIYSLSTEAGLKVFDSYDSKGNLSSWKVNKCNDTFCPNFFRNPILDSWEHFPVDEVKLVIYKNQTAVVNMVFDGQNTNRETWFSHEKLKSSPWNDLSSATPNFFSIRGFRYVRRFYITNHNLCSGDNGWLAIDDGPFYCSYEKGKHYPLIRYSGTKSKVTWSQGYSTGDAISIFIRLKT
ncbi:uncharacterized protein LOC118768616 isoform X2 [Octopus sinensis]|uniref:Uncharacterized protein LOC118768616 isoform X2 n=1 Tax=Octopus sinensis TaxID=2607531 RepID=A0A7E6FVE4_9MOLL|nr:uncharacterized protein LOC118768616 isoform X2 [Octopus sinensis]